MHRHTHRVVRGTLLVCGRPDGRLPALTSLEASTCLSVNQASSIQSMGGTCESITIGHNKSKLPLSHRAIYLKSHRPMFLSEKILDNLDAHEDLVRQRKEKRKEEKEKSRSMSLGSTFARAASFFVENTTVRGRDGLELSLSRSRQAKTTRSSNSLLGAYVNLERDARRRREQKKVEMHTAKVTRLVDDMIKSRQGIENTRRMFNEMDTDNDGVVSLEEFMKEYSRRTSVSTDHLRHLFEEADIDDSGTLSFDEFMKVAHVPTMFAELSVKNRDNRGLVQVQPSKEQYFGEELRKHAHLGVNAMAMSQSQHFSMELYETRIASMQRFVAMCVMFHQMGRRVQTFFPKISFGYWGYRMDRTHSSKQATLVFCSTWYARIALIHFFLYQNSHEDRDNRESGLRRRCERTNGGIAARVENREICSVDCQDMEKVQRDKMKDHGIWNTWSPGLILVILIQSHIQKTRFFKVLQSFAYNINGI